MGLLGFYYRTFGIKADLDSFIPYKMKKAKEERKDVGPKGDEKNPLGETQNDLAATDVEIKEVEEIPEVVQKKESVDDELEPSSDPNPNFDDGKSIQYLIFCLVCLLFNPAFSHFRKTRKLQVMEGED